MYRARINSFNNLPKEKRPPRGIWDKPYRLMKFLDNVWKDDKDKSDSGEYIEWDDSDVE